MAILFYLRQNRILDRGVAAVFWVKGSQPPSVGGPVDIATGGESGDILVVAAQQCTRAGCGEGAALVGGVVRVDSVIADVKIQIPQVDFGVFGIFGELIVHVHVGLAEAVAGEARVDVNIAGLLGVFLLDGCLIEVVDAGHQGVHVFSKRDVEHWVCITVVHEAPGMIIAPRVIVCSPELGIAGQVQEEIGIVFDIGVIEGIVKCPGEVCWHIVFDIICSMVHGYCAKANSAWVVSICRTVISKGRRMVYAFFDDVAESSIVTAGSHNEEIWISNLPHLVVALGKINKFTS